MQRYGMRDDARVRMRVRERDGDGVGGDGIGAAARRKRIKLFRTIIYQTIHLNFDWRLWLLCLFDVICTNESHTHHHSLSFWLSLNFVLSLGRPVQKTINAVERYSGTERKRKNSMRACDEVERDWRTVMRSNRRSNRLMDAELVCDRYQATVKLQEFHNFFSFLSKTFVSVALSCREWQTIVTIAQFVRLVFVCVFLPLCLSRHEKPFVMLDDAYLSRKVFVSGILFRSRNQEKDVRNGHHLRHHHLTPYVIR